MKSPFPGIDPYLEAFWSDVHATLIVYVRNQIQRQLPPGLRAHIEETLAIDDDEDRGLFRPDVSISEPDYWRETGERGMAAVAEPLVVEAVPRVERHIEIVTTRGGHSVVTVIEILSPANKLGEEGRAQYRRKQRRYLAAGVNLVEIDLLRSGSHVLGVPYAEIPDAQRDLPTVCAYRSALHRWEIYALSRREPLPAFRVPLRPDDLDVVLDLQSALDACYEDGQYARDIDYRSSPEPDLPEADRAWAHTLLRDANLRTA